MEVIVSQEKEIYKSYVILLAVNLVIFSILFLLSLYLLFRVYKLFKYEGDPVMFWSVFTISLSLFTLVTFNSIQIYSQYYDVKGYSLNVVTCMGYLLEVLIFISISLDLYKWGIFIATTKTEQTYHFEEIMKSKRKRLFCILISVLVLVGSIFTALFVAILATTYFTPYE